MDPKIDLSKAQDSRYLIGYAVSLSPDRIAANAVRMLGMPAGISSDAGAVADFIDARYNAGADVSAVFDVPAAKDAPLAKGQEKLTVGEILTIVAAGLPIVGAIFGATGLPGSSSAPATQPPPPPADPWYKTTPGIIGIILGSLLLIGGIIYVASRK